MSVLQNRIYVAQGEFAVGNTPDVVLTAILGSCVTACMWDENARVGGMNHILLADSRAGGMDFAGVNAMELLINGLIRQGANRLNLKAKLIGGARMMGGLSSIGERNAAFVEGFLNDENIPIVAKDVGGTQARQLRFYPSTSRVQLKYVEGAHASLDKVKSEPKPKAPSSTGDVQLF